MLMLRSSQAVLALPVHRQAKSQGIFWCCFFDNTKDEMGLTLAKKPNPRPSSTRISSYFARLGPLPQSSWCNAKRTREFDISGTFYYYYFFF